MKPWFIQEDNVIPFRKKDTSVVRLPNVNAYPDFLSGVQDLQNHLKQGDISSDIHKKLYQDLIHRFMKTESFETPWFLKEYTDLDQAKQNIIDKIANLQPANENDAKLLDRIYRLLSSDNTQPKIAQAFAKSIADDNLKNPEKIIQQLSKVIFSIESDYKKIDEFLKKLENTGTCIDTQKLTTVGSQSLSTIFMNDEVALKAFLGLKSYGEGVKQKGKGEWALALLSNKIRIQPGEGDIIIDEKPVELKTEAGSGGGRLGQGGPIPSQALKFWSVLPSIKNHFEQGGKYLGMSNALNYLNIDLPLNNPKTKKQRQDMLKNYFSPYFNNVEQIVDAYMQTDPKKAEQIYAKANYEQYKGVDKFVGILMINFQLQKSSYFETGEDLIKMRDAKLITGFGISLIPSSSGPREIFAQLSMSTAKTK
jgi:hypothetical protein